MTIILNIFINLVIFSYKKLNNFIKTIIVCKRRRGEELTTVLVDYIIKLLI